MKYKKIMFILITAIFLVSIASVCASDANDRTVASEDANQIELSSNDVILEDNLKTSEENNTLAQVNNPETDSQILSEDEGTYNDLRNEIGHGGDINLVRRYYRYDGGGTIEISNSGVINGNGAVIDMNNSVRAFYVTSSGVTFKNLTIKNGKSNGDSGGAIYFKDSAVSGTVVNCNFTDNIASYNGGALFFDCYGYVADCNFVHNKAAGYFADNGGGAINIRFGTVENCNFTNNDAGIGGGAIWFLGASEVKKCNFISNTAVYGGAIEFNSGLGTVSNCNFIDCKTTNAAGAVYFIEDGTVENCSFTNNTADGGGGGAIKFDYGGGVILNCNFTGNLGAGGGGAVFFDYRSEGEIKNCNFISNTGYGEGGALYFVNKAKVTNCIFTRNRSGVGSAIYFWGTSCDKTVSDSIFLNNRANTYDDSISIEKDGNKIKITFRGMNNLLNAISSRDNAEVKFTNVTYWGADGITNTGKDTTKPHRTDMEAGQNITVTADVNGIPILIPTKVTDKNGEIVLEIKEGDYIVTARHYSDSYYTFAEKTISNMTFNANVTSQTFYNKTVNITAKSDIYSERIAGKLQFILPNGDKIDANYGSNGLWWAEHTFDNYTTYQINATYDGLNNVIITGATISVNRPDSTVNVNDVVFDYGNSNVTVTTEGATGITAMIDDEPVAVINNYTIPISGLAAGNYTLEVTTMPDEDHKQVTKTFNITINKVNSTLTVNDIVFDYNGSGSTDALFTGALGVIAEVVNHTKAIVDVAGNTITVSNLDVGKYILMITTIPDANHLTVTKTAKIIVNKLETHLTAKSITAVYNVNKNLVITLNDGNGNALTGVKVFIKLSKGKTFKSTTDKKGQVKMSTKSLVPKTYTATISFAGNVHYLKSTKSVKVTVKKAKSKITAKKKTIKKAKKYTVTLKSGKKPIKKVKILLKIKKKTFEAKTNKKGKATFKIKKLTKKGTYKAKIIYKGNKCYTKATKTVKIKLK